LDILNKNINILAKHIPDKITDKSAKSFAIKLIIETIKFDDQEKLFLESLKQLEFQTLKDEYNSNCLVLNTSTPEETNKLLKRNNEIEAIRKKIKLEYNDDIFKE